MSNRLPVLLMFLVGCGGAKRAAEQAVASADSAVASIQAEAERVEPELLQPLQATIASAREAIAAIGMRSRLRDMPCVSFVVVPGSALVGNGPPISNGHPTAGAQRLRGRSRP